MSLRKMKAGEVKAWLTYGAAVLMGECAPDLRMSTGTRWIIHLLQTGDIISVPEDTLHNGDQ
jgi:hypothetical protein